MKKLLVGMFLAVAVWANAASLSLTTTGAATNNPIDGALSFNTMTFANSSTNVLIVALFDNDTTALTLVTGAYTTYSNYVGNVTNTYTTSQGVTNTVVYSNVILMATNSVSAATNSLAKIGTFTVPAGETLVVPFSPGLKVYRGLVVTNNNAFVLTTEYSKQY